MRDCSLRKQYKRQEDQYKQIRKEIKENEKISWSEASDLAGDMIDGMYGSYGGVSKEDYQWEDVYEKIHEMDASIKREMYYFHNRELELNHSSPYYFISIYVNKKLLMRLFSNKYKEEEIIKFIHDIQDYTDIKEAYFSMDYNYGSHYYESEELELHLKQVTE